jgi:hypothetical protein
MPHSVCCQCEKEIVDLRAVVHVYGHKDAVREPLRFRESPTEQAALEAGRAR